MSINSPTKYFEHYQAHTLIAILLVLSQFIYKQMLGGIRALNLISQILQINAVPFDLGTIMC